MEVIMTTHRVLLALLFVSVVVFAISCGDHGSSEPSTHHGWQYNSYSVIRDYQYLENIYFDLARRDTIYENDLYPGDSITELDLYFSVSDYEPNYTNKKHLCHLWVDPFDTANSRYADENVQGAFVSFSVSSNRGTFTFHPTEHYIIMSQPVTNVSIGAYIKYRRVRGADTTYPEIGSRPSDNSTYTLKLIATSNPQPTYVTWNYVWRNVYSLGGRIDDPDNLEVKIFKGAASDPTDRDPSDPDNQRGISFIRLLGLDSDNNGQIDSRNPQVVDLARGHLRFPRSREPFADPILDVRVDTLYHTNSSRVRTEASEYYLFVQIPTD
jgi:hypothetical protein